MPLPARTWPQKGREGIKVEVYTWIVAETFTSIEMAFLSCAEIRAAQLFSLESGNFVNFSTFKLTCVPMRGDGFGPKLNTSWILSFVSSYGLPGVRSAKKNDCPRRSTGTPSFFRTSWNSAVWWFFAFSSGYKNASEIRSGVAGLATFPLRRRPVAGSWDPSALSGIWMKA